MRDVSCDVQNREQTLLSQIDSNADPDILVGEFSKYLNLKGEKYFKRIIKPENKVKYRCKW